MSEDFIDELRNALDKGAVLSGSDIDARYHHDLAGHPAPKPRAVVRPRTTEDVSALLRLCHREGIPVTMPPEASPSCRPAHRCKSSRNASSRMA